MMVTCEVVTAQVRKFKAVNTGSLGVTFAMDTKAMEKSGFTVTPDKMPLLAGAPVHASQELTVTLQVSPPPLSPECRHHHLAYEWSPCK